MSTLDKVLAPTRLIVPVLVLAGLALAYCVAMPGESYRGAAPLTTEDERAIEEQLRAHVTTLAVDVGERRVSLGNSLHRAEAALRERLADVAPNVSVSREPLRETPGDPANLILELPGTTESPVVIVGAHYDSALGSPGANDNATGVAAALVIAKHLAKIEHTLPIRIVLFANEEPPYFQTSAMGSLQHAAGCQARHETIRAMLSLETMGYYSDIGGSQHYPALLGLVYPSSGNFIAFVGNLSSRLLVREVIRAFRERATIASEGAALPEELPGVGWSDQWAFWQFDYPAVMVTDTALFRDPSYHTPGDVLGNVSFDKLARVVRALEDVIEGLAKG